MRSILPLKNTKMASGQEGDGGHHEHERMPKNVKDLLQMCVTSQPSGTEVDGDGPSLQPMSKERKEWLETALTEMTVSPVERMKECLKKLSNKELNDVDEKIAALEELKEWCENLDFAIDFHKIGGYPILPELMDDVEPEIRWNTLELIAILVQNNPYCQKAALEAGLLPLMLHKLDNDTDNTVKVKALYAISCLTRDVPNSLKIFLENDGLSVIMRAMQTDVQKLKIKACFMLSALCTDNPEVKDILCKIGMVDQLVGHLNEEHGNYHEHIMSALLSLIHDHIPAKNECQRSELNLRELLTNRIKDLQGKDEFREEREYATEILKVLSIPHEDQENVAR